MEIYLTKMTLNPLSNQVRSEFGRPQELHRTISRGFRQVGDDEYIEKKMNAKGGGEKIVKIKATPRNKYNILYRLDIEPHRGKAFLLVQSEDEPDWSFLNADYADEIETKEVGENYEAIENGMRLIFRLQANPTKRVANRYEYENQEKRAEFDAKFKDSKNRRRISIYKEVEQIEWLERQGENNGFKIADLKINPAVRNIISAKEGKVEFKKPSKKNPDKKHQVTYGSVIFEGVLQVTDAEKFKDALVNGIGQGKAYGFGLLSVAKVKEAIYE
jgi:CRISPR system Cascade subunit CasE